MSTTARFYYQKIWQDTGSGDEHTDIWALIGSTPTQITSMGNFEYATAPRVSPDGTLVAFSVENSLGGPFLYVMNADGSNVTQIDSNSNSRGQSWRPDGQKIVYRRGNDIRYCDPDGSNNTLILSTTNLWSPTYNYAGTKIIYQRDPANPNQNQLRIVNEDGTGDTNIEDTGLGGLSGFGIGVYSPSVIVYTRSAAPAGTTSINEDGTGRTTLHSSAPSLPVAHDMLDVADGVGFGSPVQTTPRYVYKFALDGSGSGAAETVFEVDNATFRSSAQFSQGRVYTTRGSDDALVSFLPDGTDVATEDTVANGPVIFETILPDSINGY